MNGMFKLLSAVLLAGVIGSVHAKLPAAPADPAKAEADKMKKADAAKKEADALSKAQDRAADNYKKAKGGGMMPAKAEMAVKPKAKQTEKK